MRKFSYAVALLGLISSSTALAVPGSMHHQGRLFDALGAPLTSTEDVTFTLWDAAAGGGQISSETQSITFDNGYYAVQLTGFDGSEFEDDDIWLGITVGTGVELPRIKLDSVPFAFRAQDATNVSGGTVNASEVLVGGTTVIDSSGAYQGTVDWGNLGSVPTEVSSLVGGDSLSSISCSNAGETAVWDGTDWACRALDFADIGGAATVSQLPVGTTSAHVAAGDHSHDLSGYYTQAEVDALISSVTPSDAGKPHAWVATGTSNASHTANAGVYTDIPEMEVTFDLDGDYVVVTQFDANFQGASGAWVATRLDIDGAADPYWTHTQPIGSGGEDDHQHLFRIEQLSAGSHTIKAQWGDGGGTVTNNVASSVRARRLSVFAIPVETGVQFGYTHGSNFNACHPQSGTSWSTVNDMALSTTLAEDSVVMSFFDINVVGGAQDWVGTRISIDGATHGGTHSQPYSGGEDDHLAVFQIDQLGAGAHDIHGEWGRGSGTMCNNTGSGQYWDRRLGFVAIPESSGVIWGYANPRNDVSTSSTTWSVPGDNTQYSMWVPPGPAFVAMTNGRMTMNPGGGDNWAALRLNVDGNADLAATHVQPSSAGEDDELGMTRVDVLQPGDHTYRMEWRAGSGTMNNNAGNSAGIWLRRMGTVALPDRSYR